MNKQIVTRFAPSPTGYLHLGGLRTALYAWLWARQNNGTFILRLEDTDRERLVPGAEEKLKAVLHQLGLDHDQYFRQSDRLDLYKSMAEQLISSGWAYRCYCSSERLETVRQKQIEQKLPPRYDGHCRELLVDNTRTHVVRFKIPQNVAVIFQDVIRGQMQVSSQELDDFVLLKSDGWPTYHLAMLVDDHDMAISHVIRAEEWLPSLPKHVLLYQAAGFDLPTFVHLPMLLNPDKSKLSKRQGDVAVEDYLTKGYLPQALINYVSLLGWHGSDDREFFVLNELVKEFTLERLQKSSAIFDVQKLRWYNAHYIRQAIEQKGPLYEDIVHQVEIRLPQHSRVELDKLLTVFGSRIEYLDMLSEMTAYVWVRPDYEASLLIFKKSDRDKTASGLELAEKILESFSEDLWQVNTIESDLKKACESQNLGFGDVFWPLRVSLSGQQQSPSPAELAWLVGKKVTMERISLARKKLESMV
mgnify:CR=1 FL=1